MPIVHTNRAATRLLGDAPELILKRLGGDALQCFHAVNSSQGCGSATGCAECVMRKGVELARGGTGISRQRTRMQLQQGAEMRAIELLVTACPMRFTERPLVLLVLEDITELSELRALLPICSGCKKIRNDNKYWEDVAQYLSDHTDLRFTHGLCPECVPKYFPEFAGQLAKE
ncbi:MAG: hypothetical protein NTW03_06970 [Verrucomicrobia bacterium]|nr:hypothetical protein [Verrucomicrobiota bacterium]